MSHLPDLIASFYAAQNAGDFTALAAVFTPDAMLGDEATTSRGPEAIAAWLAEAKRKYRHVTEVIDVAEDAGEYVVSTRVSGEFPGSPIVLKHRFRLAGDRIKSLEIA